jgi:hypothetical protein
MRIRSSTAIDGLDAAQRVKDAESWVTNSGQSWAHN